MKANEVTEAIQAGEFNDDELRLISQTVSGYERAKAASFEPGSLVRLRADSKVRPKYLHGVDFEVISPRGKGVIVKPAVPGSIRKGSPYSLRFACPASELEPVV